MPKKVESLYDEKFGHVIRILLTIYEYEKSKKKEPSTSEIVKISNVPNTVFYTHLKDNMIRARLIEQIPTESRVMIIRLTERGRKLAEKLYQCKDILEEIGIKTGPQQQVFPRARSHRP